MTDILQSSDGRSMLFCIFVTYKAKAVLFLSRAVLLCTFHFPRKGFWHNVVLIKGDFCSILFRFLYVFFNTMQGERRGRGIFGFGVFFLLTFLFFFFFLFELTPGQRIIFFCPHQQLQKSLPVRQGFAKPTCRAALSGSFRFFPILFYFLEWRKKKF